MAKPEPCEPLKLYLFAADSTVAAVLIEEEKLDHKPVYYVSHTLKDAETRYSNIEKLAYAREVITTSERKAWVLFTDGSSTSQAGGAGIVLTSPEGFVVKQVVKFKFPATNNEAEYEGLIVGLKLAHKLEASVIDIFSDSQLVVKQVLGEFKEINDRMATNMQITLKLLQMFTSWTINNIGRSINQWADALSKVATSDIQQITDPAYFTELSHPSIEIHEVKCISNEED
ncbi:uncharacterized protein LOC141714406 [Apium graveolens]|uniref:uncharacterized protein LOC141714406 n=1 Tax=Apium graveolens TaxID=4045 RepID=UPI003D795EB1